MCTPPECVHVFLRTDTSNARTDKIVMRYLMTDLSDTVQCKL